MATFEFLNSAERERVQYAPIFTSYLVNLGSIILPNSGFCRGSTVTEKVQLGPCWVANRNSSCRIPSSYFSFQGQTLYKGGFESIVLTRFSSACPKEFFNVSWSGTFEGEFATQNCPRGAAGESNSGKISGIIQKASREYYKDT